MDHVFRFRLLMIKNEFIWKTAIVRVEVNMCKFMLIVVQFFFGSPEARGERLENVGHP